jgi:glycosyltransferase involved in cell wall biosynthesis
VVDDSARRAAERIRLCTFLTLFGVGGTEKQVVALLRRVDRSLFEPNLRCLRRWGPLLEELEREYGPIPEYTIQNLYSPRTLCQQARLARGLRRGGVQVLHSYNFYANVFSVPAAKLAGVPCVIASIRDMGVYLTPRQQYVHKLACRFADRVVVNADAIRNWLVGQGYEAERITVIPNGVDTARFSRAPGLEDLELRANLGVPRDAQLVVLLARLHPDKGIEQFLRAAASISGGFRRAYFLIVGESFTGHGESLRRDLDYPQRLLEQAHRLGIRERVRLTGFIADVPRLLAQAALSVLPSLSEGLSNTLLESMAAGAPVVATRVGGASEAITDGEHGRLVAPADEPALARAMADLLSDPQQARRLGARARERIGQRYSLERMVAATQDLYLSMLMSRSRKARPGVALP